MEVGRMGEGGGVMGDENHRIPIDNLTIKDS